MGSEAQRCSGAAGEESSAPTAEESSDSGVSERFLRPITNG